MAACDGTRAQRNTGERVLSFGPFRLVYLLRDPTRPALSLSPSGKAPSNGCNTIQHPGPGTAKVTFILPDEGHSDPLLCDPKPGLHARKATVLLAEV